MPSSTNPGPGGLNTLWDPNFNPRAPPGQFTDFTQHSSTSGQPPHRREPTVVHPPISYPRNAAKRVSQYGAPLQQVRAEAGDDWDPLGTRGRRSKRRDSSLMGRLKQLFADGSHNLVDATRTQSRSRSRRRGESTRDDDRARDESKHGSHRSGSTRGRGEVRGRPMHKRRGSSIAGKVGNFFAKLTSDLILNEPEVATHARGNSKSRSRSRRRHHRHRDGSATASSHESSRRHTDHRERSEPEGHREHRRDREHRRHRHRDERDREYQHREQRSKSQERGRPIPQRARSTATDIINGVVLPSLPNRLVFNPTTNSYEKPNIRPIPAAHGAPGPRPPIVADKHRSSHGEIGTISDDEIPAVPIPTASKLRPTVTREKTDSVSTQWPAWNEALCEAEVETTAETVPFVPYTSPRDQWPMKSTSRKPVPGNPEMPAPLRLHRRQVEMEFDTSRAKTKGRAFGTSPDPVPAQAMPLSLAEELVIEQGNEQLSRSHSKRRAAPAPVLIGKPHRHLPKLANDVGAPEPLKLSKANMSKHSRSEALKAKDPAKPATADESRFKPRPASSIYPEDQEIAPLRPTEPVPRIPKGYTLDDGKPRKNAFNTEIAPKIAPKDTSAKLSPRALKSKAGKSGESSNPNAVSESSRIAPYTSDRNAPILTKIASLDKQGSSKAISADPHASTWTLDWDTQDHSVLGLDSIRKRFYGKEPPPPTKSSIPKGLNRDGRDGDTLDSLYSAYYVEEFRKKRDMEEVVREAADMTSPRQKGLR